VAIIDSQRAKTTQKEEVEKGGLRGYGGGKKISGTKWHLVIDADGLMIAVALHETSIAERDGAKVLLEKVGDRLPRMEKVWADRGYNDNMIGGWMKKRLGWTLEIFKPLRRLARVQADEESPPWMSFKLSPKRWMVERTIAWMVCKRRMRQDYDFLAQTTEALVYVAIILLLC
jgi:putative transposase